MREKVKQEKLLKRVLGKKKADEEVKALPLKELAAPKNKWKRGQRMKELQQTFPHDLVL